MEAVEEVSRVLKRNGKLYLTVPDPILKSFFKRVGVTEVKLRKYNIIVQHLHYRNISGWGKLFKKNNLRIIFHEYYFNFEMFKKWYFLHRLMVFKPYRRELWSYLQDSPIRKYFPKHLFSKLTYLLVYKTFRKSLENKGCWHFSFLRSSDNY